MYFLHFAKLLVAFAITVLIVYIQLYLIQIYQNKNFISNFYSVFIRNESCVNSTQLNYLVYTSNCKLVNLNPFDKVAIQYIEQSTKLKCNKTILIVSERVIKLNSTWLSLPEKDRPRCCYRRIERVNQDPKNYTRKADDVSSISEICHNISLNSPGTEIIENYEFIQADCELQNSSQRELKNETEKAKNKIREFFIAIPKPESHSNKTKEKLEFWKNYMKNEKIPTNSSNSTTSPSSSSSVNSKRLPPNVLIIGFDSVSRNQLIRTMPYTREFLVENDFIELKGYTRTGENTFPNMMAALGGMENEKWPCLLGNWSSTKMDDCPFIWKNFSQNNYATAHVEDSWGIAIFDYLKIGFVQQPSDYYLRTFNTALYKYHSIPSNVDYEACVRGLSVTEHLIKYLTDFVKVVQGKVPYFYLTWFTSITHYSANAIRAFDKDVRDLFKGLLYKGNSLSLNKIPTKIQTKDVEDNTIIFFISDHGTRTQSIRSRFIGYYEVSLPYFFVRLPPSIKKSHPHWYENLKVNSNRLTSPLDFHATLEDILSLAHSQKIIAQSVNPADTSANTYFENNAQKSKLAEPEKFKFSRGNWEKHFRPVYSMFEDTPENRSCESSLIPEMYCRCGVHDSTNPDLEISKTFGRAVVKKVNKLLEPLIYSTTNSCITLQYDEVVYNREIASGLIEIKNYGKQDGDSNNNSSGIDTQIQILGSNDSNNLNGDTLQNKLPDSVLKLVNVNYTDFLTGVKVKISEAIFEARIRLKEELYMLNSTFTTTKRFFKIIGDVSRVNRYEGQSNCISDFKMKKFCYCSDLIVPTTTTTRTTTTTTTPHTTTSTSTSTKYASTKHTTGTTASSSSSTTKKRSVTATTKSS